jgi:hypothetical protein
VPIAALRNEIQTTIAIAWLFRLHCRAPRYSSWITMLPAVAVVYSPLPRL